MGRLLYLDSLRGVASLIVAIFWHYSHFSSEMQPNSIGLYPPLYWLYPLRFFYKHGDLMVDLFFVLSGIIFSYNYRDPIKKSYVSTKDFFFKRFSRLYPVHILTLIIVALLNYLYYSICKTYPIYKQNNVYHFILNLAFLQKGFLDNGYSFNGPSWSLSIEAFMYLIFFIQSRYLKPFYSSLLFIIIGFIIYRLPVDYTFLINHSIARGLMGFFSGCLFYEYVLKNNIYKKYHYSVVSLFVVLFLFYYYYIRQHKTLPEHLLAIAIALFIIYELHYNKYLNIILANRMLVKLGDISLSIYLVHVPVQIIFLLYYKINGLMIKYDSGIFITVYGMCVLVIGLLLHDLFEKPVQNWLRTKFFQQPKNIVISIKE